MSNRTTLKGYFVTNAIPKQSDFADLIDSNLVQPEDSIRKQGSDPIAIQAQQADQNGAQQLLHFYKNFNDPNAAWKFNLLNPNTTNPVSGLNIGNPPTVQSSLFIKENDGSVGVGTTNPMARLHVSGNAMIDGKVGVGTSTPFSQLANTNFNTVGADGSGGNPGSFAWAANQQGYTAQIFNQGSDSNSNGLALKIASTTAAALDVSQGAQQQNAGTSLFVIKGNGNVGVGVATPAAKLDVNGIGWFRNNPGGGLPASAGQGIKITTEKNVGYIFSYNYVSSAPLDLVFQSPGGNVGIGTTSPPIARLEVSGSVRADYSGFSYGYLNPGGAGSYGQHAGNIANISIKASDRVVASEFNSVSDERIKKDFTINDSQQSLKTINQIQVKDFFYKDEIHYGSTSHKGVIAQELERVFAEAVTTHADIVPDIYSAPQSASINDNILTLTMKNPHDLVTGDIVRLITASGIKEVKVIKTSDTTFCVNDWQKEVTGIFVYGKRVNDCRTVNYNSIFCLGISAIQELYKQLQDLKQEMKSMKENMHPAFVPAV